MLCVRPTRPVAFLFQTTGSLILSIGAVAPEVVWLGFRFVGLGSNVEVVGFCAMCFGASIV